MVVGISGCASAPEEIKTAAELYDEATELVNAADYIAANKKYEELISTYPTSNYSKQALIDQIASNLTRKEHAKVIEVSDLFMNLYPDSDHVEYSLYMKGVSYFREDRGIFDKIGQQEISNRDLKLQKKAFEIFRELNNRFPNGKFAEDAIYRMRHLVNSIARGEILIAEFYLKREAYSAVIHRANKVLVEFPDSNTTERALELLIIAYDTLGSQSNSSDIRKIMALNFPDNHTLQSTK